MVIHVQQYYKVDQRRVRYQDSFIAVTTIYLQCVCVLISIRQLLKILCHFGLGLLLYFTNI